MKQRVLSVSVVVALATSFPSTFARQAGAAQGAPGGVLAGALRSHVNGERFGLVTSLRGLPLGVRGQLQVLFGTDTLDIVDPDGPFDPRSPTRRLVAAGCSSDHCLVYYERGGSAHTWQVALFHWTPEATRFEWGGAAPSGLKTIDDVRGAVLAGAIRSAPTTW
ncbi:MAG: hypothetical protein AB7I50_19070 [Vicinamibacterales bacterium]